MTGEEIAVLMTRECMRQELSKHARRYTRRIEDQEEYIQDAWIRIATLGGGMTNEYYGEQGRKAIVASYWRRRRSVSINASQYANGISKETIFIPENAIDLGRGRYLLREAEKLSRWYYEGEWTEYGLEKSDCSPTRFYRIIVR